MRHAARLLIVVVLMVAAAPGGLAQPEGENAPPEPSFTTSTRGLRVEVDGSATRDPESRLERLRWDWGDGDGAGIDGSDYDGWAKAWHVYEQPGTYTVTLLATDWAGNEGRTSRDVTVAPDPANAAPRASFGGSAHGLSVTVNAFYEDDDGEVISWLWDWGDGATQRGMFASHDYAQAGVYTLRLIVRDDSGAATVAERTVRLDPDTAAPRPSFNVSGEGRAVRFDASGSRAGAPLQVWRWEWEDGASAWGEQVVHAYEKPGEYWVRLTVADADGWATSVTRQISVKSEGPPEVLGMPVYQFPAPPEPPEASEPPQREPAERAIEAPPATDAAPPPSPVEHEPAVASSGEAPPSRAVPVPAAVAWAGAAAAALAAGKRRANDRR